MDTPKKEANSSKGRKHYSHAILDAKKDKRREEGEARQREHDKLTTAQKIALAKSRPGESKREIARLTKKLEQEKAQKAAQKAGAANPQLTNLLPKLEQAERRKTKAKKAWPGSWQFPINQYNHNHENSDTSFWSQGFGSVDVEITNQNLHPHYDRLISDFHNNGYLTQAGMIVLERKIASIKRLRELVTDAQGTIPSLVISKNAIEDWTRFSAYVRNRGYPDMRGLTGSSSAP